MNKIVAGFGAVVAALSAPFVAFAQTPTITEVSSDSTQLLVNGAASYQEGLFDIAALIWPYVLTIMLFFLAIRFGMGWLKGKH